MTTTSLQRLRFKRGASAMTLIEVVVALAVFSLSAVALVGSLNAIADTTMEARRLLEVEQSLESLIDEFGKVPNLAEKKETIKAGKDGVGFEVVIELVRDLKTKNGAFLPDIYRIAVTASWKEGGRSRSLSAETLRNARTYMPQVQ